MLSVGPGTKSFFSAFLPYPQLLAVPAFLSPRGGLHALAPPSAVNCCCLLLSGRLTVGAGCTLCYLDSLRLRQALHSWTSGVKLSHCSCLSFIWQPNLAFYLGLVWMGKNFVSLSGVGDLWYHGRILGLK